VECRDRKGHYPRSLLHLLERDEDSGESSGDYDLAEWKAHLLTQVGNVGPIDWKSKRDPLQYPVRYMAWVWQSTMEQRFGVCCSEFTSTQYGQLKTLMKHLGERTPYVIDWALDVANWWHFCQRARVEHRLKFVPDRPEIGFLLQYRGHAVTMMCANPGIERPGAFCNQLQLGK
jgi:hypothetical protein